LTPVAGGRVEVLGRDVTMLPPERRDVVYLHQTPLLFPHLSVFDNVAFPLRVRRRPGHEVTRRVHDTLAAVRLDGFATRAPRTLSGGQRHRVALARAIVARPALLLLDEPLASLDPALREEVRAAILALQRTYHPALIMVTHDFDEAGLVADRIAVMIDRRLAQVDAPVHLFTRPASLSVARFLGIPNEVGGRVDATGEFVSALGRVRAESSPPPGPAVAVFRADAVRMVADGAPARVVGVRHLAQRTTVECELVAAPASTRLEVQLEGADVPAAGDIIRVAVLPGGVTLFSAATSG
jgi:putative spermidine/putrescine transport system ATP-binding protein